MGAIVIIVLLILFAKSGVGQGLADCVLSIFEGVFNLFLIGVAIVAAIILYAFVTS
jgi:hypothetical protein